MALQIVRETTGNRCVAAFTDEDEATEWTTALGSGYGRISVSDAQQGTYNAATIIGAVIANNGAVSAYAPSTAQRRVQRRNAIKQLVRVAYERFPLPLLGTPLDIMVRYLQVGWAAASVNANIDTLARYNEIEAMLKGGDYPGGIEGFAAAVMTTKAVEDAWATTAGLPNSLRTVVQPDSDGAVDAKAATLPNNWHVDGFHPRHTFI